MMHYNDIVVSICDSNRKSLREYSTDSYGGGRSTQVHIPFETEYQLLIKNNSAKNIRLDIDIDGTNVSNDGIIVNAYRNVYLERFVNSQNKFKFVPVSNAGVADPTSKENGIVTVVAHFEKAKPHPFTYIAKSDPLTQPVPFWPSTDPYGLDVYWKSLPTSYCSSNPTPTPTPPSGICGASAGGSSRVGGDSLMRAMNVDLGFTKSLCPPQDASINQFSMSNSLPPAASQAGATVEGSKSHQQFTQVPWEGDDDLCFSPVHFKFKLLGISNEFAKDWQELERLKKKLGVA